MNKFLYELKLRKREFLNECVKYDSDFSSKLSKVYFEIILDKFTCYPKLKEKEIIINKFLINDTYVNYIDICNLLNRNYSESEDEINYSDPFLQHLNKLKQNNLKNSNNLNSADKLSRVIDLQPLELLNYQISEENFLIKIAKNIFDFLITHNSDKNSTLEETFTKFYSQSDFDLDNKYTIGELNQFLISININLLSDSDLRFLFETFPESSGRINKEDFYEFIINFSKRNFSKLANTDFIRNQTEIFNQEELKDEEKIQKVLKTNYLFQVIKECLQVLGKNFLFKYFAKYFEINENILFIDSVWLEVGLKRLGYKDVSSFDMGNFKFVCVKKVIGLMRNKNNIQINIEKLFNFVIDEFKIDENNLNRDSNFIIDEISKKLLNDMDVNLSNYINKDSNNEFEFRRKFIKSFNFVDHNFFDHIVKFMNVDDDNILNENLGNNFNPQVFRLEEIKSLKWNQFGFNLIFMSFIRYYDQLGIMLQLSEIAQLKNIYNNLESKLFPKNSISKKEIKTKEDSTGRKFIMTDDKIKSTLEFIKNNTLNKEKDFIKNNNNVGNIIDNNLIKFKSEISAISIKENIPQNLIRKTPPVKLDSNLPTSSINNTNVNDTANIIPQLYNLCTDYLKNKYTLTNKLDHSIIYNLGCCKIFRDHFTENKVDIRNEINFSVFMSYIKSIPGMTDTIWNFLNYYANSFIIKDRNKNSNIKVQFLFMKIEEILLEYSKINK